jgi:hypothetical protein
MDVKNFRKTSYTPRKGSKGRGIFFLSAIILAFRHKYIYLLIIELPNYTTEEVYKLLY